MLRFTILLTAIALFLGCGKKTSGPEEDALTFRGAKVTASAADLPDCDSDREGQLFYVLEDQEFNYCDGEAYIVIDLTGPQGDSGAQGEPGQDGISILWLGNLDSHPDNPSLNEAYYNTVNRRSYIWDGSSWKTLVQDGKSILSGTADPTADDGINGDFYLNTETQTLFGPKAGGEWPEGVSLIGAAGDSGAQGPQGDSGAQGEPGQDGIDGRTILSGSDDPADSDGADGDFYINTATQTLFGPKSGGSWPAGISLTGSQGDPGQDGNDGTPGVDGRSIVWKGSLASAPASPDTNWAYYNNTDGVSYIYNGNGWDTLAIGGFDYSSMNCPEGSSITGFDENGGIICSQLPLFRVLYNGNGSTGGNIPVDTFLYLRGEFAVVLGDTGALVNPLHRYINWNTMSNGSGSGYAENDTLPIGNQTIELFAQWDTAYTLTYDGNAHSSGSPPTDGSLYLPGEIAVIKGKNTMGKTLNRFIEWNRSADGSGKGYTAGDTLLFGDASVVLHAIWDTLYTLTYNGNGHTGGTPPADDSLYIPGETAVIKDKNTMDRTLNRFIEWNRSADGTGKGYTAGDTLVLGDASVVLHAVWDSNYTVTYAGNGNTVGTVPTDDSLYISGESVTVLDNTGGLNKTTGDYGFRRWNSRPDGSGTDYDPGQSYLVANSNMTFYAKYDTAYSVTYAGNGSLGGSVPVDGSVYISGQTVTVRGNTGNLVNSYYTFGGWSFDANTTYNGGIDFPMPGGPVVLSAIWNDTVMDIDGNVYHTVRIGSQIWTVENLRVTKLNDGTNIAHNTSNTDWRDLAGPMYCYYNNTTNTATREYYGALYNWDAGNSGMLAPPGWHVPTDAEWQTLMNYLIAHGYNWDKTITGNKIGKSMSVSSGWTVSNVVGEVGNNQATNNSTGYSAVPAGYRYANGTFSDLGNTTWFWSATQTSATHAFVYSLMYHNENLAKFSPSTGMPKRYGYSVRLVKD